VRRRLAIGALAVVLVWPPVHHVLVRTLEIDAWTFFGWSMYAVPNLRLNVRAASVAGDGTLDWNAVSLSAWKPMRLYGERRLRWGRLLTPDTLASEIFELQPELPGLLIRVVRFRIDRESARIGSHDTDYVYAPSGLRVRDSADARKNPVWSPK
jgi:hypothetical protein